MKHILTAAFTALLLLIATSSGTTAAPTEESSNKPFSFASWVDDLANPDIVALTPGQALEAYTSSRPSASSKRGEAGGVIKRDEGEPRVGCWWATFNHDTTIDDAVAMIAQLVGKGQQQVNMQPGSPEFGVDVYGNLHIDAFCGGVNHDRCPGRPII